MSCTDNPTLTGGDLAGSWRGVGGDFGLVVGDLTGAEIQKREKKKACDGGMSRNVWDVVLGHTDR